MPASSFDECNANCAVRNRVHDAHLVSSIAARLISPKMGIGRLTNFDHLKNFRCLQPLGASCRDISFTSIAMTKCDAGPSG